MSQSNGRELTGGINHGIVCRLQHVNARCKLRTDLPWLEKMRRFEQREPLRWEDLWPGRTFEPSLFHITPGLIARVTAITGERPLESARLASRTVSQSIAFIYSRLSYLGEQYRPAPGGVLTEAAFQFFSPARLGDIIESTATVTERHETNGRRYYSLSCISNNQKGVHISKFEATIRMGA